MYLQNAPCLDDDYFIFFSLFEICCRSNMPSLLNALAYIQIETTHSIWYVFLRFWSPTPRMWPHDAKNTNAIKYRTRKHPCLSNTVFPRILESMPLYRRTKDYYLPKCHIVNIIYILRKTRKKLPRILDFPNSKFWVSLLDCGIPPFSNIIFWPLFSAILDFSNGAHAPNSRVACFRIRGNTPVGNIPAGILLQYSTFVLWNARFWSFHRTII